MIDRERLRPMEQACRCLGWLVACDLLAESDADAALMHAATHAKNPPRGDRSGWQAWLAWTLAARIDAGASIVRRAEWQVQEAVAPLLARTPRMPAAAILRAAYTAAGGDLPWRAVRDIVESRMTRAMRRGGRHGR